MSSLEARTYQLELMDLGSYSDDEYLECLQQLSMINRLTNGYNPTISAIAHFAKKTKEPLRILDIGFGYGDTLREIAKWSEKENIPLDLAGIDLNPRSKTLAESVTPKTMKIKYLTGNVFEHSPSKPYDVCINALFAHHLNDEELVAVMKWMDKNSRLGFFINDLHRHQVAYHFIKHVTRLFRLNRLIRNDAPLSVARSFRRQEWPRFAMSAGLDVSKLKVSWHWAFRYGVMYDR